jgi:peptide/nickel transport system permease protein
VRAREVGDALGASTVPLVPVTSYPLFAALTPLEAGLALAWPFVLLALVLGRWRLGLVLALCAGLAGGFAAARGPGAAFASSSLKAELTRGEIELVRAVFAPVPYGFAEQHPEESLRPPTWLAASELDERGAYVHGSRAPRADPITGFVPSLRPVEVRTGEPELNAAARHWLGTDTTGRDQLARLIHGARASLFVGGAATVLLFLIGVTLGALAGYRGGWVDAVLSRAIEVVVAIPLLFLVLVAVSFLGPSVWNVVLAIGCAGWTGVARLARAEFQRARELPYVEAARSLGYSGPRILCLHVLPNALPPLIVAATFSVAGAILVESTLSFLGYGVRMPFASWGTLTSETRDVASWWVPLFPGLALFVTLLCVQGLGEALRRALDPRAEVRA